MFEVLGSIPSTAKQNKRGRNKIYFLTQTKLRKLLPVVYLSRNVKKFPKKKENNIGQLSIVAPVIPDTWEAEGRIKI
jgi:hypothetical protein